MGICFMDDPYSYDLAGSDDELDDGAEDVHVNTPETYQEWDVLSTREYANVAIREYGVGDEDLADTYYAVHPDRFAHDIGVLVRRHEATSVNFRVIAVDPETDQQTEVTLRIDVDDGLDMLVRHIQECTAPAYSSGEEGSDKVSGMNIIWQLDWVQLITQMEQSEGVTVIVGNSTMFRGYRTKVINTADHGIDYSSSDCVFICLNEMFDLRYRPEVVRQILFGDRDLLSPINLRGDMTKVARYYGCTVAVHSLDDDTRTITSRDKSLPIVRLVKMGAAIGVIESVHNEPEDNLDIDLGLHAYYDFETVSNSANTQIYAFSLIWVNAARIFLMHHDSNVLLSSIRKCLKDLMKQLLPESKSVYLHAWNGARFDHPLLLKICNKKFKVGYVTMNPQREVLGGSLHCAGKSLLMRDPCKMLGASLQGASDLFGLEKGKLDLDHDAVESAYLHGELEQYLSMHRDEIEAYAMRDVELLKKITEGIMDIYADSGIRYSTCLTRNMASHAMWKNSLSTKTKENLSSIQFGYNEEIVFSSHRINAEYIREQAIAGRVQCRQGEYDHVTLVDFRSMYPSVATGNLYPCGEYHPTSGYARDKLGLYIVNIIKQQHPHVIPYRSSKHKVYDWNYEGQFQKLITNVDVECLVKSGAEFEIVDGIIWEDSTNYFGEHMTTLYHMRRKSKEEGNMVLAEHYKGMSNSLTGAIFQQLRREYVKVFPNKVDAEAYVKMHSRYVQMTHELIYNNGQILLYFMPKKLIDPKDISAQRSICKSAMGSKPIILTMFIYSYARCRLWEMWRHVENNNIGTVIYCDTDSLAIAANRRRDGKLINVSLELKGYVGNDMGDLEIVMRNCNMIIASPKVYAMKDSAGIERVRAKGINKKSMLYKIGSDSSWIISAIKDGGWDKARQLYSQPIEKLRTTLSYESLSSLLRGYRILSVYWWYSRTDNMMKKKYGMKVLSAI
jgi:hypothetical protein